MKKNILLGALTLALAMPVMAQNSFTHPWQGKKVVYIGDSITDPRNNASTMKYWDFLQEWLDITPYVPARSGFQWNSVTRQMERMQAEGWDNFDAILIFLGTNDYNHSIPLGEWFDEQYEMVEFAEGSPKKPVLRRHRQPAMDPQTFRGRINLALDTLKKTWPDKQIVLLTPIHRAGFFPGETNWQPDENYSNALGLYIDDYVGAVKEAGNVWAVPVIDLNAVSGLFPMLDCHAPYFRDADNDRLHPNDEGHKRMAKTLFYQLLAIPCL